MTENFEYNNEEVKLGQDIDPTETVDDVDQEPPKPLPALDGSKTLHNSTIDGTSKNVSDLVVYGNGDTFQLICKASSKAEGWMKSTKAMQVPNGVVIQVTTQQGDSVAEALTFVPGIQIQPGAGQPAPNGRGFIPLRN